MFWLNGSFHENTSQGISVSDRGFLLGDGLFETIRVHDGRPLWFPEHWARLKSSAEWAFLPIPYSEDILHGVIRELSLRAGLPSGVVRLTLTRGVSGRGLALPDTIAPTVVVTISPLPQVSPQEGISVAIASMPRSTGGTEWMHKSMHYLSAVREYELARRSSCSDFLWLSSEGKVLETSTSNVFWVVGGEFYTAPADGSILPGIARAKIVEYATHNNIRCHEIKADLSVVQSSDCVFAVNSVRGIVPIARLGGIVLKTDFHRQTELQRQIFQRF